MTKNFSFQLSQAKGPPYWQAAKIIALGKYPGYPIFVAEADGRFWWGWFGDADPYSPGRLLSPLPNWFILPVRRHQQEHLDIEPF